MISCEASTSSWNGPGEEEKTLPEDVIEEGIDRLKSHIKDSKIVIARQVNDRNGDWHGPAFPLMESVGEMGEESPYLTKQLGTVLSAVTSSH